MDWFRSFNRVVAAALFLVTVAVCCISVASEPPITGTAVPEFEPLDEALLEFGKLIGAQAITVAVSKDRELLYSRGYGWRDANKKQPTQPDTLMRIASVTKPITAVAVRQIIRQGKLTLDTKAFELLKLSPPPDSKPDPRLAEITVAHLLDHKGGWDRDESFDPMFRIHRVERTLRLRRSAKPADVIRYMLGQPLEFDPGARYAYSNFGYCVLGRVMEKATGKPYFEYIRDDLCKPLGIADIKLARNAPRARDPREVWYPTRDVNVEVMDAHGGLIASAPALATFLDYHWCSGEPRRAGQRGAWVFFGTLSGTTAMVRQRSDGHNIAVLYNNRREDTYEQDDTQLQSLVDDAIDKVATARATSGK
jgi:N-acyl-D-amino-acid deacylase